MKSSTLKPYSVPLLLCQLSLLLLSACGPSASTNDSANRPGASAEDASTSGKPLTGPQSPEAADTLILALGDSLYAGYNLDRGEGFPEELQNALVADGMNVFVVNAGVSGDTSAAGRQRLDYALEGLPRNPDLVVLGLGGNDMLRGIEPEQTRANLDAMLKTLSDRKIKVVLTGMLAAPNLGPEYADAFNPIFPDLAKQYDAALYPFFLDGVVTDSELMLEDGIHPNAEGVDLVVEKIAPVVTGALAE
ncbi:arylesterase [Alterisphingorhabdus coralli]|uniref:Arylesterase n=1 Tax=Alterisphingorhabdus coralli TaxID=3071408 RepID=A0AA97I1I2_9SPHN|nr:arylesterase [Parasphingorhabdus sp. SCSIO 66989]WOE76067.1 arylesterase [Parasphingorhabdus sp. SCSIO 66989]